MSYLGLSCNETFGKDAGTQSLLQCSSSQPCGGWRATAEDPESSTVSRSSIYHSLSGLLQEYLIYLFRQNVQIYVDLYPLSPTGQLIFSES